MILKRLQAFCAMLLFILLLGGTVSAYSGNGSETVYITNYGDCYHTSDCGYLWDSKYAIALEDAYLSGYSRCSRCHPPKYTGTATREENRSNYESSTLSDSELFQKTLHNQGPNYVVEDHTDSVSQPKKQEDTKGLDAKAWFPIITVILLFSIIPAIFLSHFANSSGFGANILLYFCVAATLITAGFLIFDVCGGYVFLCILSVSILVIVITIVICRRNYRIAEAERRRKEAEEAYRKKLALWKKYPEEKKKLLALLFKLYNRRDSLKRSICRLDSNIRKRTETINRILENHHAKISEDGRLLSTISKDEDIEIGIVFYSQSGVCYHDMSCRYRRGLSISLYRDRIPDRLKPCGYCHPDMTYGWIKDLQKEQKKLLELKEVLSSCNVLCENSKNVGKLIHRLEAMKVPAEPKNPSQSSNTLQTSRI